MRQYTHIICSLLLLICGCAVYTGETTGQKRSTPIRFIFFDLDGVLLNTSRWQGFQHLISGKSIIEYPSLIYTLICINPKDHIFAYMKQLPPEQDTNYTPRSAYDPAGATLPRIMSDWLAGRPNYDSYTIITYLESNIDADTTFTPLTRHVLKKTARIIFDPVIRCDITHPLPEGVQLLTSLHDQFPNHTFGILSNYDTACFAKIYNKPELQPIFQNITPEDTWISADLNYIKPDPSIYHHVCNAYHVDPAECLFIDDQEANVLVAQEMGMHAFVFDPKHCNNLYHEIVELLTSCKQS